MWGAMEEIEFLTPSEMAKIMKVRRPTIYDWIRKGKLKAIRSPVAAKGPYRIPKTEVKRLHAMAYEVQIEKIEKNS